ELLVTIAVAAIALTLAIPGFTRMLAANRLAQTTNALVQSLTAARMQAVRANQATIFCSNSTASNTTDALGNACGTAAGAVYNMEDGAVANTPVRAAPSLPSDINLNTVNSVRYGGTGLAHELDTFTPYSGLIADISSTDLSSNNHRCIYLTTGSAVNTCTLSAACPASRSSLPANAFCQ
ncbi:MAG: GspH/FimT family pseudopilin, partial [Sinobacteraceae bacterium]|nr:GspH/FimT family pseudopilin [Nevskiaceae bacterium]